MSKRIEHSRPNGRPVHPACPAQRRRDYEIPCTCDKLWEGWDGTQSSLDAQIAMYMRMEKRRKAESTDELQKYLDSDVRRGYDGFWSRAENLRCIWGKPFLRGDLDMNRFKGLTWMRAREAMKGDRHE